MTELIGQALPQESTPLIRTAITTGGCKSHHPSTPWGSPAQRLTRGQKPLSLDWRDRGHRTKGTDWLHLMTPLPSQDPGQVPQEAAEECRP